jgi:hypothetical protein
MELNYGIYAAASAIAIDISCLYCSGSGGVFALCWSCVMAATCCCAGDSGGFVTGARVVAAILFFFFDFGGEVFKRLKAQEQELARKHTRAQKKMR